MKTCARKAYQAFAPIKPDSDLALDTKFRYLKHYTRQFFTKIYVNIYSLSYFYYSSLSYFYY